MKPLKEGLLSKKNIDKLQVAESIELRKKNLRDGDLCLQRDGEVGVYISNSDYKMFNMPEDSEKYAIMFYYPQSQYRKWERYLMGNYDDNLIDRDGDEEYDCVKIVRGLCDPKWVNDREKLEKLLMKVNNEKTLESI